MFGGGGGGGGGGNGLLSLFKKILPQCSYSEIIKYYVHILKFDFKKIELQLKLDSRI